jgi:GNAT superfamily N-acetyltransferase
MGGFVRLVRSGLRTGNQQPLNDDRKMSASLARYSLRPPQSGTEWASYHAIRRDAIFAPLLPAQRYDETDADEFKPGNLPHVLVFDGAVIGTVRIDLIDNDQAGLRLIGIRRQLQRQGHGRALLQLAERLAESLGRTEVVINAHPMSLTFYLANGYAEGDWRDAAPVHPNLIRVGKRIG